MEQARSRPLPLPALLIPLTLLAMWGIPRALVAIFGQTSPWTAFFYQYLLGGIVFGIGLLVIRQSKACDFDRPRDRMWYRVLIFGYFWYAAIHALLIWLSISVPFAGNAG